MDFMSEVVQILSHSLFCVCVCVSFSSFCISSSLGNVGQNNLILSNS